jgi:hypothetical protein
MAPHKQFVVLVLSATIYGFWLLIDMWFSFKKVTTAASQVNKCFSVDKSHTILTSFPSR